MAYFSAPIDTVKGAHQDAERGRPEAAPLALFSAEAIHLA